MVLHVFQQDLDGLPAKVGGAVLVHQGIGLVDEQHAAQGLLHRLLGLQGRLAHIARHQAGAVHLHQLALAEHPHRPIDLGQQPGHGGLARAGVAHEDQVQGHGGHRQVGLLPQLAHLYQVDKALHIFLYLVQAAQAVQLSQ